MGWCAQSGNILPDILLSLPDYKPPKMKKFFTLALLLILGIQLLNSQTITTISGTVVSKNTKEKVPFASVAVLSENDSLVAGNMTSEDGGFTIEGLAKGKYTVSVSYIGYRGYRVDVLIGELNKNYDLGKIEIVSSSTELEEVTISGNRSIINSKMDKKTFYMSNNPAQSGGSVMDAMKAMPSISFDQDGKVILRGSDKVIVLIDSKQSSLTGYGNQKSLDNMPAANIERIEVINNPSAKYDASGMAGIINIINNKTNQNGFHGSMGFDYGLGIIAKHKADLPSDLGSFAQNPKFIPSLDLNWEREKLSVYLQSEVLWQEKLPNNEFTTRYYDDGRVTASQVPENRKETHCIVKGGVDYRFNENNTLTLSGIYDWKNHIDSAQVPYMNMLNYSRNRFISWKETETTVYMNYASHFEHKFKQVGHSLSAHLQYSKGWEDEIYYINDSSDIRTQGRDVASVLGTEYITSMSVDYTKPTRTGRFEGGTKLQIRNLPVEYSQQRGEKSILYPGMGSWTEWGESIYAGYFNWVHERKLYDIEAGLRSEYTRVLYDMDTANIYYTQDDAYDYFRLFPNVRLSLKINQNNKFSAFYNQRVDRPGERELRMYAKSDDHELVKVGNPYLRPQYTQSWELGYMSRWKSGSVYLSAYLKSITDQYMRVYTQDNSRPEYDVILKSYANTGKAINRGLELVFSQQLFKFWKLSGNMSFYQIRFSYYEGTLLFPYEHSFYVEGTVDNSWDAKLISAFNLSDSFDLQITALYMAPRIIPMGRELWRSSVDLGLVKKIWKGKGELTLAATDLFNNYGIVQEINGDGFTVLYENYYETQMIRIGFKYKF